MNCVNLKALSYEFGELVYRPVRPTDNIFVIEISTRTEAKNTVLSARPQDEPYTSDIPVQNR
jgi:hypothetical protein